MSASAEKLVKLAVKTIARNNKLDYSDLKDECKKIIRSARNMDESILGMMEEMLDLGNVGAIEELEEFDIETLKNYCRVKELSVEGSDSKIRDRVWKSIESEYEIESEPESEDESVVDSDASEASDEEIEESAPPKTPKKSKSKKVTIVE